MNDPNFYDMTKITTGYYDPEPIIINRKPKVGFYTGIQQQTPVGMGAFFEEFEDGKIVDAKGWDFAQTFKNTPFQFGTGMPLYPYRLNPSGKAMVIQPSQFLSLESKKKRRRKLLLYL